MTNKEKMIELLQQHKYEEFYYMFIDINSNFRKQTLIYTSTKYGFCFLLDEKYIPETDIDKLTTINYEVENKKNKI